MERARMMPVAVSKPKAERYVDEIIVDALGRTIGTVRITGTRVLWKPAKSARFSSVRFSSFVDWLTRPPAKAVRKNCEVVPGARA
jgi:hypothetical protein